MYNNKIKVLHIGLSPNHGGIESVVHSWWKYVDRERFHFDFLNVYHVPIAFEEEFKKEGSRVHHITMRKDNPFLHYKELKKIITDNEYDFIHCHVMFLSEPEPIQICNSKMIKTKPIVHSHTAVDMKYMSFPRKILHTYGKYAISRSYYIRFACGQEAGEYMFGTKDFTVIENGIDTNEHSYSATKRKVIREKYNLSDDIYLIGHVGRIAKEKNYPYMLETFAELKKKCHHAKLLLIGNVRTEEIDRLITQYNIHDSVIFTGKVTETSGYYSAMDCYFMPSLYEGLSVSLVEAQANGLPCVVSNNIARESAVSNLVSFIPLDEKEMMIEELLKRRNVNNKQRTKSAIYDQYDIRKSTRKLESVYLACRGR